MDGDCGDELRYPGVEVSDIAEVQSAKMSGCVDPSSYGMFVDCFIEVWLCEVLLHDLDLFDSYGPNCGVDCTRARAPPRAPSSSSCAEVRSSVIGATYEKPTADFVCLQGCHCTRPSAPQQS